MRRAKVPASVVLVASFLGTAFAADAPLPSRPNIVVILADDFGPECVGAYGGTSYRTPNLDALARSGIRFANAYATPLCSPSRVQLMTGRYGFRTGWTELIGAKTPRCLDPKEKTFGHILKAHGYATALAGKWQLARFDERPDHVKECGFDESCAWAWVFDGKKTPRYWRPELWQDGMMRGDVADRYGEDVFREFLVKFMERSRGRPFFAYYPMVLTHDPFEPPPGSPGAGKKKAKASTENFPAMVAYLDATVGRFVAELERLGLRENTLILFTGDNGTPRAITSRLGERAVKGGKGQMTHIGCNVPLLASWPGKIPAGRVSGDLIDLSDVVPTLCELTGAPLPEGPIDGRSFAPQLRGERGEPREWIFSQLGQKRFVRGGRFLLHEDGRLYDVVLDPFEEKDLAGSEDAEAKAAKRRLGEALARLVAR